MARKLLALLINIKELCSYRHLSLRVIGTNETNISVEVSGYLGPSKCAWTARQEMISPPDSFDASLIDPPYEACFSSSIIN